ncbi:MAG: transglutaminase family protein [Alphaproteobacteria bacterium]|nr:transglutaminase family protein [Alphaproteobacteria bacterium]MBU1515900.1 transglutaminase family protein [Alphaproteobacteria bacterium]MBU2094122.1 transglutaminase family protein [Alphaproteobacteria bacterium]MBU2151474.1 transglutaminase family protein [Alphaproteobacteria bacterium]MBU2305250.1 transglutaminase family protein [Alphaproteobacteria bacterium]
MPLVSIRHRTTYRYRNPVAFGEHRVMYRPLESFDQRIVSTALEVGPEPAMLRHVQEASGATVAVVRFDERADRLSFESQVTLDHVPQTAFELEGAAAAIGVDAFAYDPEEAADLARAMVRQHADDGEVEAWARRFVRPVGRTRLSTVLSDMTHGIRGELTYGTRLDGAPQAPAETLAARTGSCRDFAVLMAEAVRSLGLAARFTSGYVYSGSPKAARTGGGHTHAWVRVYLPGCGWTDFDPTNGIVGGHDLVRVAEVVNPRAALPLHGAWSGLKSDFLGMDVEVDVKVCDAAQPAADLRVAHGR